MCKNTSLFLANYYASSVFQAELVEKWYIFGIVVF